MSKTHRVSSPIPRQADPAPMPVTGGLADGELSDRDLEAVAAGTSTQCQRDQTGSSINVKRR